MFVNHRTCRSIINYLQFVISLHRINFSFPPYKKKPSIFYVVIPNRRDRRILAKLPRSNGETSRLPKIKQRNYLTPD